METRKYSDVFYVQWSIQIQYDTDAVAMTVNTYQHKLVFCSSTEANENKQNWRKTEMENDEK